MRWRKSVEGDATHAATLVKCLSVLDECERESTRSGTSRNKVQPN